MGTTKHRGEGIARAVALALACLAAALPGPARAQAVNQILSISPATAAQGTANLLVTFTLDSDFPAPPPAGVGPQSVTLGAISGRSITHTSNTVVTAVFDIPAQEAVGAKDAVISFAIPGGTLLMSLAGGFTVTAGGDEYNIERTLADGAQLNTIAFDGLGFLTGSLGGQSFLPPGKVADYSGFQYLRDNDPTQLGHNTDFVTIIAFNVLHLLTSSQVDQLVARAQTQVSLINEYAYTRFPLIKAFRRLLDGDLPAGSTGLSRTAVRQYSADLYRIDGAISYDRAKLTGGIVRSLSTGQRASLDSLKALHGVGNWTRTLADPLRGRNLDHDVNVAVMTYASEMFGWYAGSVDADVYFCPERQGTCFGSFYLKDWPAMGNPNYTINEQLTASAGQDFLAALADSQSALVTAAVNDQRAALYEIVDTRRSIATQLRRFMTETAIDSAAVMTLSTHYGELDGEIVHLYATRFARISAGLTAERRATIVALADSLGNVPAAGAFLYSAPIPMPAIANTDFLFEGGTVGVGNDVPHPRGTLRLKAAPNPFNPATQLTFLLPRAGEAKVTIFDARGRITAELPRLALAAGEYVVRWDGRDRTGHAAPSGVYLARLRTAAGDEVTKITLGK